MSSRKAYKKAQQKIQEKQNRQHYRGLGNFKIKVRYSSPKPGTAWVAAADIEELLLRTVPVFSHKDPATGLFTTWGRNFEDMEKGEVMGFVLGPYQIPPIHKVALQDERNRLIQEGILNEDGSPKAVAAEQEKSPLYVPTSPASLGIIGIDGKPIERSEKIAEPTLDSITNMNSMENLGGQNEQNNQ